MKKNYLAILLGTLIIFFATSSAYAHCEIPCGIYDDVMRLNMISEHVKTIEKSMEQILELQKEKPINHNQLVRWINNKEDHANKVQEIISQYFLTQRIKFDDKDYAKKLAVLHKIMVSAMKCKQTVDLANLKTLRAVCRDFEDFYREEENDE